MGGRSSRLDPVPDRHVRRGRLAFLPEPRTRRGSVLHHQGRGRHRDVAGRNRRRDAGASRRPDREEAAGAALFRQGHDLHQAGLHRDAGRFQGQHAGARRAGAVLSAAQEAQRHQGRPARGPDRPVCQRRIRRRRFDPLYAHRRRRRLRPDEKGRRGACASAC